MKKTAIILLLGLLLVVTFTEASFRCADGSTDDTCTVMIVAPVMNVANESFIKIWGWTNSSFTEVNSYALPSGDSVQGGVACYKEQCYFKAIGASGGIYSLNMVSGSAVAHPAFSGSNFYDENTTPVFLPVDSDSCPLIGGSPASFSLNEGHTVTVTIGSSDYEITLDDVTSQWTADFTIDGVPFSLYLNTPVSIDVNVAIEVTAVRTHSVDFRLIVGGGTGGTYTEAVLLAFNMYSGSLKDCSAGVVGLNFTLSSVNYAESSYSTYTDDSLCQRKASMVVPKGTNGALGFVVVLNPDPDVSSSQNLTKLTYIEIDFCDINPDTARFEKNTVIKDLGVDVSVTCLSNVVRGRCNSEGDVDYVFMYGTDSDPTHLTAACIDSNGYLKYEMSLDANCSDLINDISVTEISPYSYYDGFIFGKGIISFEDVANGVALSLRKPSTGNSSISRQLLGNSIPVDFNGDNLFDLITMNTTDLMFYLGNAVGEKITAGSLAVNRLYPCDIDFSIEPNGIGQVGVIATVPSPSNKQSYYYTANFGDGSETITQDPSNPLQSSPDLFQHTFKEPGNHTVNASVCLKNGTKPDPCASSTCVLVAPYNVTKVDPVDPGPGECLGKNLGFVIDNPAIIDICADAYGYINFNGLGKFMAAKKEVCDQRSGHVTFYVKMQDSGAKADLVLRSATNPFEGSGGYLAQLKIEGSVFKVFKNSTWTIVKNNVSLNTWHRVKIEVDTQVRKAYYYLDDEADSFYSAAFLDVTVKSLFNTQIMIKYFGGNFWFDKSPWGCVVTGAITIPQVNKLIDNFEACGMSVNILSGCDPINGTLYSAAVKAGAASDSYDNVAGFCRSKDTTLLACYDYSESNNRVCTYEDLKNIVNIRPACTAEVMNYCVDFLYKLKSGGQASDGVVICSATLGFGVAMDKVTVPIVSYLYRIFLANWLEIALLIAGLIVIFTIIGLKKKT